MKKTSNKTGFWIFYHLGMLAFSAIVAMIMKYRQVGDPFAPTVVIPFFTIFLMSVCGGYLAIFMVNRAKKYTHQQLTKKIVPALLIFYVNHHSFFLYPLAKIGKEGTVIDRRKTQVSVQ